MNCHDLPQEARGQRRPAVRNQQTTARSELNQTLKSRHPKWVKTWNQTCKFIPVNSCPTAVVRCK